MGRGSRAFHQVAPSLKYMRFVFISTLQTYPWGGSEELWSQTALRLREEGHEVAASVVWWPQLSSKILKLKERGVKLLIRKLPYHCALPIRVWRLFKRELGFDKRAVHRLFGGKADLIVISQAGALDGLDWMKFCDKAGLPFVSIAQANTEAEWLNDGQKGGAEIIYRAARKIFCVSRHNLELLENQVGGALPNGTVVWNPFNVPTDKPPVWPKEDGIWRLACVARLEPAAKGQDLLFKVLSDPRWKDRSVEISLYGKGPYKETLQQLSAKLNLQNVHFRGHVNDIQKVWEHNHLLVLPSRHEGLPLALVEAMWSARPAVVTDIGGNAEACLDGETGFVAAAPTVKLLDQTLERAWTQRHDWHKMGQAARKRAEQLIPKDPVSVFYQQLLKCARPLHSHQPH
jgi:glycosyltransferase involved in cell wall biosynthesis